MASLYGPSRATKAVRDRLSWEGVVASAHCQGVPVTEENHCHRNKRNSVCMLKDGRVSVGQTVPSAKGDIKVEPQHVTCDADGRVCPNASLCATCMAHTWLLVT